MELLAVIIELIVADLILGGDNAIVISMATKNLPSKLRLKASVYGAIAAILLRILFIILIIIFGEMHIILLNLIAGLLLIKVAIDMIVPKDEHINVEQSNDLLRAIKTIVIADAVMSFDNAIVIATIAEKAPVGTAGELILIVSALFVSFPIILFGAQILSKVIDKFKFVIYLFGLLLINIGVELAIKDSIFANFKFAFVQHNEKIFTWLIALIIFGIIILIKRDTIFEKDSNL